MIKKLKDVARINEKTISSKSNSSTINYIDIASVENGFVIDEREIKFTDAPTRARRIVRDNDILLSTVRPNLRHYAFIKNVKENTIASTGFAVISCKKINPRFLYYFLTSNYVTKYLSTIAESHTSTYPSFPPEILEEIDVPFPSITEQDKIADILGSLDDKIELNRQMNQILEAMAHAIFKSWFVDFDPVYAKMEGREYPLPPEILDLFPDELEESELGLIPKEWRVVEVKELGEIITGKTPSTKNSKYYDKKEIPFIKIPDMHYKFFITETNDYLSKAGGDSQKTKYLPPKSICVSCIATPGLIVMTTTNSQTNQQINSIVPFGKDMEYYILLTMKRKGEEIQNRGSGGSVLHNLNKGDFEKMKLILPCKKLISVFQETINPIFDKILINQDSTSTLTNIRNALLPNLLNGSICINSVNSK